MRVDLKNLKPSADGDVKRDVAKAAQALEAFFLRRVLSEVHTSQNALTGGGFAGDVFKDMLDEALADSMSKRGGIGIGKLVERDLLPKSQRAASPSPATRNPIPLHKPAPPALPLSQVHRAYRTVAGVVDTAPAIAPVAPSAVVAPVAPIGPLAPRAPVAIRPAASFVDRASHVVAPTRLALPVLAPTSSQFGLRPDPFDGKLKDHEGLDLAAPDGTRVGAAAAGVVSYAGKAGGYGNLVIVDHGDGLSTRYAHLSRASVKPGERVAQGASVGLVGETGRTTGPHLHFEVRRDGRAVDPKNEISSLKVSR